MNWFLGLFIVVVSFGAAAMQPLTDKQLDDVTAGKTPPVGNRPWCVARSQVIR